MSGRAGGARAAFTDRYGEPATHEARAPGRVNLIGEHIDYCGLAVLPLALERSIRVLFRAREDGLVRLATALPDCAPCAIPLRSPVRPGPRGDWANYARAAAQAVLESGQLPGAEGPVRGFDGLVWADLPPAAGLSSSSALVVAVSLALLASNGAEPGPPAASAGRRLELAEVLARGERYVGTAGGGMDQAACLLGRSGHALRLDFDPLRATPIPVPDDWRILVAHSGERAEKSGAAQAVYNERTEEAGRALAEVRAALGAGEGGYRDLMAGRAAGELLAAADGALDGSLARRFRHVVTEAERVERMEEALRDSDLEAAGRLLLASQASLRDDYGVSTARLDALVEAALAGGAAGARLTGAGLGGSIVALSAKARADDVLAALAGVADPALPPFVAVPADGARVRPL